VRSSSMTTAKTAAASEFADFYAATFHRVAAQLYAYLGDHSEAQDLTQEAFCRALDRWSLVSAYENPAGWVRQVAWNLATSRLRHLQVVKRFVSRQRQEHVPPPGPERVDLTRALATLPPKHRLAVVLHHVGRLSTSEIAEQQGVAEGTVRSWLSRGRAQLAEQLIDWDQAAAVPPEGGVEAAVAKVRHRRAARKAVLAAVLAILVAIPLAVLVLARAGEPDIIQPTPQPSPTLPPSPSPAPDPVELRRIVLPDAGRFSMQDVWFVDREHAWLWHDPCERGSSRPSCGTLATTADGGKTWRKLAVPPVPEGARPLFLPFDANTATFQVTEQFQDRPSNYLHTTDGGATFKSYPVERPPAEAVIGMIGGRYRMLCPGATGLEDGAWGISCERLQLVKLGEGPVAQQPPLRNASVAVDEGADGRLWLSANDVPRRLMVSEDGGKTWKELPWPSDQSGYLILSPDGKQAWTMGSESSRKVMLELVGTQWVRRFIHPHSGNPILLNAGVWLVSDGNATAYLHNGVYTRIPGLSVFDHGWVLRDGTIVLRSGDQMFLGTGEGMQRQWVRFIRSV
jgi:RNA polymerase sigma factor (sigma-70 family)